MSYLDTVIDFSEGYIKKYNVNVLNYEVGEAIEGGRYVLPSSRLFPISLSKKVKPRSLTLELEFIEKNAREVDTLIAEFCNDIQDGVDIHLPDGYGYFCVIDKVSSAKQISSWIRTISIEFVCIRHGTKAIVNATNEMSFYVGGMIDTEAVVTIVPKTTPTEATVIVVDSKGNEMTNVTVKNIESTVIVDGISTKVTQDGANKFVDTDLFEFPKLKAGKNTISFTGDVSVNIAYYPLYL